MLCIPCWTSTLFDAFICEQPNMFWPKSIERSSNWVSSRCCFWISNIQGWGCSNQFVKGHWFYRISRSVTFQNYFTLIFHHRLIWPSITFKWHWTIHFKFQTPGTTNSGEQIQRIVCTLHLEEEEVTVIQEACTCYTEEQCNAANPADAASDGAATDGTASDTSSNDTTDNSNRDRGLGKTSNEN